jgi:hypothetical protein
MHPRDILASGGLGEQRQQCQGKQQNCHSEQHGQSLRDEHSHRNHSQFPGAENGDGRLRQKANRSSQEFPQRPPLRLACNCETVSPAGLAS